MEAEKKEENLYHSMVKVMQEVKNIEKALTVGSGSFSYKGVSDKDVKQHIGQAMARNGLVCVPIKFEPKTTVERWEVEEFGKMKQKVNIFVEVLATFRITHADTKESIDIVGYGHGQDNSDKAAGKATTYALKNALLYSFLVPTGDIDDTDKTHSNDIEQAPPPKPALTEETFNSALPHVISGAYTIQQVKNKYDVSEDFLARFNNAILEKTNAENKSIAEEGAARMVAKSESTVEEFSEGKVTQKRKPKAKEEVVQQLATTFDAVVVPQEEKSGYDKMVENVQAYTSSSALIDDKGVIELDITLERLNEEEKVKIKKVVNDHYKHLTSQGL